MNLLNRIICKRISSGVLAMAVAMDTTAQSAPSKQPLSDLAWLTARAQIEDMLVDYYALFASRTHSDFGSYYADDGVLDVNGIVRRGKEPINALYAGINEGGKIHVLITNLKIVVESGGSASADLIWTEVNSESHSATPHITEQGREHDDLTKRDGRWYFAKRVVTNDGGLPAALEKGYKER